MVGLRTLRAIEIAGSTYTERAERFDQHEVCVWWAMLSLKSSSWPARGQTSLENGETVELARLLGALADPIRLRLVSIVGQRRATCARDLAESRERSQTTTSHHTKVLAEVGLLRGRKHGRWIWWTVDKDGLALVTKALDA